MAILTHWEGEPVGIWRALWGLAGLEVHDTLASTNDRAKAMARKGARDWTLILAEAQSRGRGRGKKRWHSPPGKSLLFSLILPGDSLHSNPLLPLRMGLAVARGLEGAWVEAGVGASLRVSLKWPNDLLMEGRMVGGILCEGGAGRHQVAGVGINLRQTRHDFPPELRESAASLEMILEKRIPRGRILGEILGEVRRTGVPGGRTLGAGEVEAYAARDHLFGQEVVSEVAGRGIAAGLTPEGYLRIRREDGAETQVRAGSVRLESGPAPGEDNGKRRETP